VNSENDLLQKEDADTLIFEEHPNAKPDKKALLFIIILVSLAGALKIISISDLLFAVVIWSFII